MEVGTFIVNITSEQSEALSAFYREVVGLPVNMDMGEFAFNVGGATFIIDGHSETHGPTKEPQRLLLNFFVDDLVAEQARLEAQDVNFIRSAGKEPWGGLISTFTDPDGNYCQLVEFKPE